MIARDKIRPAIRDMDSVEDLEKLIVTVGWTPNPDESDKQFVRECASEIYWRTKDELKGG